ncbi:MAG: hypothetical protein J7605_21970 [Variovorax sp.]|nr:hypothetical protein [Variovorax sp.]
MVCKTACQQCSQTGLPILFTRYATAYSSAKEGMAALDKVKPDGKFKTQPGGVALQTAKYNVRMLRAGYLYIRVESKIRRPEWIGYVVHPHGYLTRFDVRHPEDAVGLAACSPQAWGANRCLVWIRDAQEVTRLNHLFHPDALDYEHLKSVIEADLGQYTQSFDVAAWAKGSKAAPDTAVPTADVTHWPVAEFRALNDEALRTALEPQMHGLMGSSAKERGWGEYEDTRDVEIDEWVQVGRAGYFKKSTIQKIVPVEQLDYEHAHGPRLKNIAKFLADNNGAIVACEDAIGIAAELGHLQSEAQMGYVRWQAAQADGAAPGVTNEWVFQTATAAQSLKELIKMGAVGRVNERIAEWDKMLDQMEQNDAIFSGRNPEVAAQNAQIRAKAQANQQRARVEASAAGLKEFNEYFDNVGAANILEAQRLAYETNATRLAQLGIDHVAWLSAPSLMQAIRRYSAETHVINKLGGGGALAVQISQCMAGTEGNSVGQRWIAQTDLFGDNPLSCVISFNNKELKRAQQDMFNETLPARRPDVEPSTDWSSSLVDKLLKPYAARFALGDAAIDFASDNKLKPLCQSALLRKMAWPLHIASLLSVKMMQTVKNLPVVEAEARIIKYVALAGFASTGKTAAAYAETLRKEDVDRLNNSVRLRERAAHREGMSMARKGAPHARGAALSGVFDVANALVKGYQLGVKKDARTSVEMVGNLLQGTGSVLNWRAKAYEVSIFEGARAENIFVATSQHAVSDKANALRMRALRMTAFKFLLPAAVIGMFWDGTDAHQSRQRGDYVLSAAQWGGVFGAAFTITATGMAATGAILGIPVATWAMVACVFGMVGAALTLIAVVAFIFLQDAEWVDWLKDNPLNKKRKGQKPIHKNLQETLQRLANAQAAGL